MTIEARCVSLTGFLIATLIATLIASRECSCACQRRLLQVPMGIDYA
jgi:hypothetical protein